MYLLTRIPFDSISYENMKIITKVCIMWNFENESNNKNNHKNNN